MAEQNIKPIYEFLMWDNCSNNCAFCFQRDKPRLFNLTEQQQIAELVIQYLESDTFIRGSHVLFVGGELFDDSQRKGSLIRLFDRVSCLLENDTIDQLFINTNLLYDIDCLSTAIEILKNIELHGCIHKIHFTTSFDKKGRFRNETSVEVFFRNLQEIRNRFSALNIFVNMILTNELCQDILDDNIDFDHFQNENMVKINLIPYIVKDASLMPSRNTLFKSLNHLRQVNQNVFDQFIAEQDLKQPRKMMYVKDGKWVRCECELSECGHSVNFKKYSSQNSCFVCDMKKLFV